MRALKRRGKFVIDARAPHARVAVKKRGQGVSKVSRKEETGARISGKCGKHGGAYNAGNERRRRTAAQRRNVNGHGPVTAAPSQPFTEAHVPRITGSISLYGRANDCRVGVCLAQTLAGRAAKSPAWSVIVENFNPRALKSDLDLMPG